MFSFSHPGQHEKNTALRKHFPTNLTLCLLQTHIIFIDIKGYFVALPDPKEMDLYIELYSEKNFQTDYQT